MTDYTMTQKHVRREVFNAFVDRMLEKENQKYVDEGSDYRTSVLKNIDVDYNGTYLYGDIRISLCRCGEISSYKQACQIFYEEYAKNN